MTISAIGYVVAMAIFVGGVFLALRGDGRRRGQAIAAALVLALIVGWVSWLMGTQA